MFGARCDGATRDKIWKLHLPHWVLVKSMMHWCLSEISRQEFQNLVLCLLISGYDIYNTNHLVSSNCPRTIK